MTFSWAWSREREMIRVVSAGAFIVYIFCSFWVLLFMELNHSFTRSLIQQIRVRIFEAETVH